MNALILLLLLPLSSPAATETHGGHVISEEGKIWLRDLRDKTSCAWQTGSGFSRKTAGFPAILAKIRKGHAFFGSLLEGQLAQIKVCLSEGELRPVPEADQDLFLPYDIEGRQLGTRVWTDDDPVSILFIDSRLYEQLPEEQRPYFLLHELAHGLIPFSSSLRSIRLRSLVKSLYLMREQEEYSREELQLLLDASLIGRGGLEKRLEEAARKGDLAAVKEALGYGVRPESTEALYLAAAHGRLEVVKLLAAKLSSETGLGVAGSAGDDYMKHCEDKDRTTGGGLWRDNFDELPRAYQYLVAVACRRPENLLPIVDTLLRIRGISWSDTVVLLERGTLVYVLLVHSAPDLANLLLDRKVIVEVPEAERIQTEIWWWFRMSERSQRGSFLVKMRPQLLRLYRRLGGQKDLG